MKLHGRTTQPGDLDQCLFLLRDRFLYREDQLHAIRAMWSALLLRDVGRSAVVFDEAEPERILAFGISAALKRQRFDSILRERTPFTARALLEEWSSDRKPFLDENEYATENAADGLNVFVLHNGISEVVDVFGLPNMLSRMSENLVTQYAGCQLKAVMHEPFGVPPQFAIDLGMQSIDYAPGYLRSLDGCPVDRRPSLIFATREYAKQHPGNIAFNALFLRFSPPRFSLNAIERRLLRFAAEGESDLRIADFLSIAPRTLKKRWGDIYLAMEPVSGVLRDESSVHRGAESRRHVLLYIRQHPEELHPYAHAAAKGHGSKAGDGSPSGTSLVFMNGPTATQS